ncbi:hypothetical protein SAMN04490240_2935 [Rhodococcus pyridinivorans]|uniref:hypothetical protein n=1 Tax=Rhodococcus pyridinivorans TaxID=103816 RepID=UPI0007CD8FC0|nr:hypothetical protein [Rhodococcus pyridinivorans]SED01402.1 hypothetical protein SAMN04490240_2935 [Rhodococcus pyridinivorans]
MHPPTANGTDPRLSFWLRVREFAVPPSMIEDATDRRRAGDWRGACAAAGFDPDLDLRVLRNRHGVEVASQVLDDLRHLAPDLLRWHLPRVAPDGLLRPGLTITLARYGDIEPAKRGSRTGSVHLVVHTAPAWADAGQRIALTLWDGSDSTNHPHPRPNRRFRFDLHRHLWDVRRSGELPIRGGVGQVPVGYLLEPYWAAVIPEGCAVDRWAAECDILLRAHGRRDGPVRVRCGSRHDVVVEPVGSTEPVALRRVDDYPRGRLAALPVLPDAATWVPPDLALLRSGAITVDRLHPLVAAALDPDRPPPRRPRMPKQENRIHLVDCRGERHRLGVVDGVLTALDHDPAEIRREELLAALGGTPLPCLHVIDQAHRRPDCLPGVRERLDHGDADGALAVVEGLLGPGAVLRDGPLLDELRRSADRRTIYDRYLSEPLGPPPASRPRRLGRSRCTRSH